MENQITLAPGAGQGIGKLLFDALIADAGFLRDLAEAARGGLRAETPPRWDKGANGGEGGWTSAPDYRVRVQTLFGLLAQAEGDPIKRVIHQRLGGDGAGIDPLGALRDSPALQAAVERTLEKAKWRTSGNQAGKRPKKAEPVLEVE